MERELGRNVPGRLGLWLGIAAVSAAVGIGIARSRGRKSRMDMAVATAKPAAGGPAELADATRDIVDHVKSIYTEGRKAVVEASELWAHGRKLVAR